MLFLPQLWLTNELTIFIWITDMVSRSQLFNNVTRTKYTANVSGKYVSIFITKTDVSVKARTQFKQ